MKIFCLALVSALLATSAIAQIERTGQRGSCSGSNKIHDSEALGPVFECTGAVSRKTHGVAGDFDIPLPLSGDAGAGPPSLLATFFNGSASPYWLTVMSSTDGSTWRVVKDDAYRPSSGELRDPSVIKIANTLWVVYTAGTFGDANYFTLIKSTDDGLSWTFVKNIASLSSATQTWAPEWFMDSDGSLHVIVSISTDNAVSFTPYEFHPATATIDGTWSGPTAISFDFGGGGYDSVIVKTGSTYNLIMTPGYYEILATSTALLGPYSFVGELQFGGAHLHGEGMTVFPLGDKWGLVMMADGMHFATSHDLLNWTAVVPLTTEVASINHGTVIPLTNPADQAGVECRSGGATGDCSIVFMFTNNVTGGGATVDSGVGKVSGSPVFSGKTMIVNLAGVANAQTLAVSVSGVTDEFSQLLPGASVNVRILVGDTTGNGSVNSSDVGQTKLQSGHSVDNSTFRSDTTADGAINSSDITLVKSHSGEAVATAGKRATWIGKPNGRVE